MFLSYRPLHKALISFSSPSPSPAARATPNITQNRAQNLRLSVCSECLFRLAHIDESFFCWGAERKKKSVFQFSGLTTTTAAACAETERKTCGDFVDLCFCLFGNLTNRVNPKKRARCFGKSLAKRFLNYWSKMETSRAFLPRLFISSALSSSSTEWRGDQLENVLQFARAGASEWPFSSCRCCWMRCARRCCWIFKENAPQARCRHEIKIHEAISEKVSSRRNEKSL